jgi:hypothetical protein
MRPFMVQSRRQVRDLVKASAEEGQQEAWFRALRLGYGRSGRPNNAISNTRQPPALDAQHLLTITYRLSYNCCVLRTQQL